MQKKAPLSQETYVRQLPFNAVVKLGTMLDICDLWEKLAAKIPKKPDMLFTATDDNFQPRYSATHIMKFNQKCQQQRGASCTKALLTDWGIQNCKLKHLVEALNQANLRAAAQYIQEDLLRQHGARPPETEVGNSLSSQHTPSQPNLPQSNSIHNAHASGQQNQLSNNDFNSGSRDSFESTIDSEQTIRQDQRRFAPQLSVISSDNNCGPLLGAEGSRSGVLSERDGQSIVSASTADDKMSHFSGGQPSQHLESSPEQSPRDEVEELFTGNVREIRFDTVRRITNNFDRRSRTEGGNLIAEGGFGTVFIGNFSVGYPVAIKLLKTSCDDAFNQFKTEVNALCQYKHENLVSLLGYSSDGGRHCLVYQYMPNGSLEDRLACRDNSPPLSNNMRLEICKGTARGIAYLHEGGLIHRDIKSANILLDSEFTPKVADFATARVASTPNDSMATIMVKTNLVIGTPAYLAPEATNFQLTKSLDSYSYGIVLLEILTGLPPIDQDRDNANLKFHVQEHCSEGDEDDEEEEAGTIYDLLDEKGGPWDSKVVDVLYSMSCRCLNEDRRKRPKLKTIESELEMLSKNLNSDQSSLPQQSDV